MKVNDFGNIYDTHLSSDVGWTCSVNGQSCIEGCHTEFEALTRAKIEVEKELLNVPESEAQDE